MIAVDRPTLKQVSKSKCLRKAFLSEGHALQNSKTNIKILTENHRNEMAQENMHELQAKKRVRDSPLL